MSIPPPADDASASADADADADADASSANASADAWQESASAISIVSRLVQVQQEEVLPVLVVSPANIHLEELTEQGRCSDETR